MKEFYQGDIILATFPFSTYQGAKVRPCIILAACETPNDYLACYVSSSNFASLLSSTIPLPATAESGLKRTSFIRVDKISVLHTTIITGKIGEIAPSTLNEIKTTLRQLFQL